MKKFRIEVLLFLMLLFYSFNIFSQENSLSAEQQDERIIVRIDDKQFTSYRYGDGQKYPYFYPLIGPQSGISVTTESDLPYPHHRSLWFACDRVNGFNFWQEGNDRGQIISKGPKIIENTETKIHITDQCEWRPPGEHILIIDNRDIIITAPNDNLRIIDFTITFNPIVDISIQKTNHSLFSARIHEDLSVKKGGIIINSEGKTGEKETAGQNSSWCDYYGKRFGITEGLAIFDWPNNLWYPSKWFTRDYGFFSPTNLYWREDDFKLNKGEEIVFKYRVIVHTGTTSEANIKELYSKWTENK